MKENKKLKKYIILTSIVITLIIIIALHSVINNKIIIQNKDFTYIGAFWQDMIGKENYIFKSYNDYYSKFNPNKLGEDDYLNPNKLSEKDFEENNYVVISMFADSCGVEEMIPTDYAINGNNINVTVKVKTTSGSCAAQYLYYLLKVDKEITTANVNIEEKYISTSNLNRDHSPIYAKKPIIYLYPTEETDISIKLLNNKYLTTTYPKYNSSWEIKAYPNGKLIDKNTGREHYALYWEGKNYPAKVEKDGFIVKGEETTNFLEEKLKLLGLTEREADEFIIYWLPELEQNKYNYIRFATEKEINNYMPLKITPTPDTIIRILMTYKPLDKKIDIIEQKLNAKNRNGFTAIEWGGSLIK